MSDINMNIVTNITGITTVLIASTNLPIFQQRQTDTGWVKHILYRATVTGQCATVVLTLTSKC